MTVEPMTDVDRIRAQWVDDLRRAVTVSKHDKHMQVSPLQVACLFKALDAERTRADAAEAERDAAVAKERERCIQIVGDRIMAARLGELDADLRSIGRSVSHAIRNPTAAQETPDVR